ncbi:acyclic terpene utilization AtuA family protein [Vallitalea guaymasensis]|uniref:Acyclic terpene utilization AtuA family protein n=1 Tax=Vallitalea guaymasensis TaxID=1185412 RepID=A0A8J8SAW0_9FIRM|nr:acyclic terpene utilization AtuA family protein [Vallitalea guaymasensis]QUH27775.1 acyclic terpene utilization AtuA family protein [Vallitalea guaymasensis]
MSRELRVLSPTAILGYGFPMESFEEGMKRKPHVIAVDAGSTDPGPYYLGAGISFTDESAVKRDLEIMIKAARENGIPVIVGTAGGSGGEPHLQEVVEIVKSIGEDNGLAFKMAVIHAEIEKEYVINKLLDGKVKPLHPVPELTLEELEKTERIVGQMGLEPIIKALEEGAEVIIAGRAYDPTVFAALAVKDGFDAGLALHMGKILECASIAATPGSGSDCMFGYLGEDNFRLEPLNPIRKCTTLSVAAHTLYEKTNPYILPGPGGILDLQDTKFHQETDNIVKVTGSKFVPSDVYTVKLEGTKKVGYRTVSIAGTRDSIMISQIESIIQEVRDRVKDNFKNADYKYHLDFKVYGRDAVMGSLEPKKEITSHEIGIVIEAVADTQKIANTICSFARSTMLHYGYDGRISTAGNLAFPYSPSDFKAGEVYEFSIYHIVEVDDPYELFKIDYVNVQ